MIWAPGLFIISTGLLYYFNFGYHGSISSDTAIWGQFGDYFGGVINPILSFISIILLIRSLDLQRIANDSLISEAKRQQSLEEINKFELRFYNLIEAQRVLFDSFSIEITEKEKNIELKSSKAVTYIEDVIFNLIEDGFTGEKIRQSIETIDPNDNIFSVVRRFWLILKVTNDKVDDGLKNQYYEILITLTDYKLICLIAIASFYFDWECVKKINKSNILSQQGLSEYMSSLK